MLQGAWPRAPAAAGPTTREPTPPLPTRAHTPTPFAGLTPKPHCDACEPAPAPPPQAPSAPPPRLVPPRGRRRPVATSTHGGPKPHCRELGGVGWGKRRAHGHPNGGPWRQWLGGACRGSCRAPRGPLLQGKRASVALSGRVLAGGAAGVGSRGTARGGAVAPQTVLPGRGETAEPRRAFSPHCLHDGQVRQGQRAARFALRSAVQAGAGSAAAALERLERSPQGGGDGP
jgi:hypothetical protein